MTILSSRCSIAIYLNIVIKTEQIFNNHKVSSWCLLEFCRVRNSPGDDHQVHQNRSTRSFCDIDHWENWRSPIDWANPRRNWEISTVSWGPLPPTTGVFLYLSYSRSPLWSPVLLSSPCFPFKNAFPVSCFVGVLHALHFLECAIEV